MLAKMEWTNDRIWSTTIPNMTGTRTPIHTAGETYRQVTGTPRTPLQRAEKQNPRLKTHHPTFKARAVVRGCRCHRQTRRLSRWNIFSFRFQRSSHQKIPRSNHTNTLRNGRCLFQFLLRVWATTLRWSCWCEVWLSCNFVRSIRPSFISFDLINVSTLYHLPWDALAIQCLTLLLRRPSREEDQVLFAPGQIAERSDWKPNAAFCDPLEWTSGEGSLTSKVVRDPTKHHQSNWESTERCIIRF